MLKAWVLRAKERGQGRYYRKRECGNRNGRTTRYILSVTEWVGDMNQTYDCLDVHISKRRSLEVA